MLVSSRPVSVQHQVFNELGGVITQRRPETRNRDRTGWGRDKVSSSGCWGRVVGRGTEVEDWHSAVCLCFVLSPRLAFALICHRETKHSTLILSFHCVNRVD